MFNDSGKLRLVGYVEIYDITDPEKQKLLVKKNAIHDGNMVYHLAKAMIGRDADNTSSIGWFALGDGGSEISDTGRITYRPTNTSQSRNEAADLYSRVYQKNINDNGFNMEVPSTLYPNAIADIKIDFTLNQGEPFGQLSMDNTTSFSDTFTFDELGLFTNMGNIDESYLLTHIVFHPIQKSLNRVLNIKYTIRFEII